MNLICFSHLRWKDSYSRPQYILSLFTKQYVTYFVEDCVINNDEDGYELYKTSENVLVVSPHIKHGNFSENEKKARISTVIKDFFGEEGIIDYLFWYSNPMAYAFTNGFRPRLNIYACMESFEMNDVTRHNFKEVLLQKADIIFEEHQRTELLDNKALNLIYLKMKRAIKNHFETKENKKIFKLLIASNNKNFSVTEPFWN
jgi:hypothetical protein